MINPLSKTFLKRLVTLALLYVPRNCHSNDLRNRPSVDGCNHVQLLRLIGREAYCH